MYQIQRSQPPVCGLAGLTRPGPRSLRPPPAPTDTLERGPLASVCYTITLQAFHCDSTIITFTVLSSLIYSTVTLWESDDIIQTTLADKCIPLFSERTNHSSDRPPNCGERTDDRRLASGEGDGTRAPSTELGDPPPIAFASRGF